VFLIGQASQQFTDSLDTVNVPYDKLGNLQNVLSKIKQDNDFEGIVLLSPACASYDQFSNYEQRGK
jgi:UDP-N-acetylmuramoylalanine--D-glutamate ligase